MHQFACVSVEKSMQRMQQESTGTEFAREGQDETPKGLRHSQDRNERN